LTVRHSFLSKKERVKKGAKLDSVPAVRSKNGWKAVVGGTALISPGKGKKKGERSKIRMEACRKIRR